MSKARATPAPTKVTGTPKKAAPTVTKAEASTATVGTVHDALVAVGLMATFVFLLVLLAGVGKNSGRAAVLIMFVLFTAQAVGHVNPFVDWASKHPLEPGATFTVAGTGVGQ